MRSIVEDYFEFYETFKEKYSEILKSRNVKILSSFLVNKSNIIEFHKKYVEPNAPKIVICGINPGRNGAGLTGIPFIDFASLSQMLPDIKQNDWEQSAKFFFSVIQEFGIETFYKNFHVTNISWFGFSRIDKQKNVNYFEKDISTEIAIYLIDKFVEEMELINPDYIIPLSKTVFYELESLKKRNKIKAEIGICLNHPSWVTTYRSKDLSKWKQKYVDILSYYIDEKKSTNP
jgi:hypothetical protein